ncbi:uncharacterized protein CC84DRAFT_1223416 [Paraphaeosphaeria sporulosa]|uniref:Uncharacterized protein n=1 Tax=Paraphaeosphaeria sporulosa TaxID=1460663 RepID=A0A177BXL3_9PLEO|nr:uncharacterized protein CC84DRAFT_1223416 [Paraphaeosphaeria sporulosa]OAF99136.1 hypothetical protein CC84DRAFT_1223416 [Paraphaeosphaeria sporulosa]
MEGDGLTPKQILDACVTILDNLAHDLYRFLPAVNPLRLNSILTRLIAHFQHGIDENPAGTKTKRKVTATDHPTIQGDPTLAFPRFLELAEELMPTLQLGPISIQGLTNARTWLKRRVSMGRGYLDKMKRNMRFHFFDHVHFFLEKHGHAELGYDAPVPRGYQAPPKVTAGD